MSKSVIMTFDENMNPIIRVEGCAGPECAALTKDLEAALGEIKKDTKTKEYFQNAKVKNRVQGKA